MTTHAPHINPKTASGPSPVGIDVAKLDLQICSCQPPFQFTGKIPYTPTAMRHLLGQLLAMENPHVIMEATGGYEKPLLKFLQSHGVRCSCVNPRQVRNFARAKGLLAKTDKIDAALLAEYGAVLEPPISPLADQGKEELQALIAYRRHLIDELGREKMQLEHPKPALITKAIKARIRQLEALIEKFENHITHHISADPLLKRAVEVLSHVKGVGVLSAASLLAAMPELGRLNRNQVAALAGVAPLNRDSGKMKGRRTTYGGRRDVRLAIYMAALSASKHNTILSEAYQKMIARGKARKVALIAIMRRLLIYLNSLMNKLLQEFEKPYPQIS